MKILFLGDISGRPGREIVRDLLPDIRKKNNVDFVIANAENAAGGRGVTKKVLNELESYGIDFFTTGEHVWDLSEFRDELYDENLPLVRPYNYEKSELLPGLGYKKVDLGKNSIVIISLIGQTFMRDNVRSPFWAIDEILNSHKEEWQESAIIVDFHGEATSEKLTMGYYLRDRVTAVLGTHTHVGTIDARKFGDTGYITDVGMCGPYDASLWVKFENIIDNFKYPFKTKFEIELDGGAQLNSVLLSISDENNAFGTKKIEKIERIDKFKN